MKQLTHAERNQLAKDTLELIIKLFPPLEYGEDERAEELWNNVAELGELTKEQLEEVTECGS